jgi:hypothetical protein
MAAKYDTGMDNLVHITALTTAGKSHGSIIKS